MLNDILWYIYIKCVIQYNIMINISISLDSLINIVLMLLSIFFFIELESPGILNHYTAFKKIKLPAYKSNIFTISLISH